jgi:very-short-patch-repair endonuclease
MSVGDHAMRDGQKTRFARRLRSTMTSAERLLWWKLKEQQLGWKFRRQAPAGPFVLDFACVEIRLAIEVDGATHGSEEQRDYDDRRTRYLEAEGWRVIRFSNDEIFKNLRGVVESIHGAAMEQREWARRP